MKTHVHLTAALLGADTRGKPVFELPRAGPMRYLMLPHGKYKVSARFKGLTETQDVMLAGKDGKDLYFHWKGMPKARARSLAG